MVTAALPFPLHELKAAGRARLPRALPCRWLRATYYAVGYYYGSFTTTCATCCRYLRFGRWLLPGYAATGTWITCVWFIPYHHHHHCPLPAPQTPAATFWTTTTGGILHLPFFCHHQTAVPLPVVVALCRPWPGAALILLPPFLVPVLTRYLLHDENRKENTYYHLPCLPAWFFACRHLPRYSPDATAFTFTTTCRQTYRLRLRGVAAAAAASRCSVLLRHAAFLQLPATVTYQFSSLRFLCGGLLYILIYRTEDDRLYAVIPLPLLPGSPTTTHQRHTCPARLLPRIGSTWREKL